MEVLAIRNYFKVNWKVKLVRHTDGVINSWEDYILIVFWPFDHFLICQCNKPNFIFTSSTNNYLCYFITRLNILSKAILSQSFISLVIKSFHSYWKVKIKWLSMFNAVNYLVTHLTELHHDWPGICFRHLMEKTTFTFWLMRRRTKSSSLTHEKW